jgi:hypothetical protein
MQGYGPTGRITSISAATGDETLGVPLFMAGRSLLAVTLQSAGTTSGGNVTIEQASYPPDVPYTGTWSTILVVAASSFTGGVQKTINISGLAGTNVRPRISDAITGGGTISAFLEASGA